MTGKFNIQQKLGKRIKILRESRALSQEKFAELSDINSSYLSALERGKKNVTIEILSRIAVALKIELFELFNFDYSDESFKKINLVRLIENADAEKIKTASKLLQVYLNADD